VPRTHEELQAAIWTDERAMPPATRELALALAFVLHTEPDHRDQLWTRVKVLLGATWTGRWRLHEAVAEDRPRYESGRWSYSPGACEGPRLRPYRPRQSRDAGRCWVSGHHPHLGECRFTVVHVPAGYRQPERDDRVCGAQGSKRITERDMVTGWETEHWFCSRHADRAAEVRAMLAARGEPPEPIPNLGGLLPRYFAADWAVVYARHCEIELKYWMVPYHGVDADEWPVPGKTMIPKRPRLSLVQSA
jgi:hypothetical protein